LNFYGISDKDFQLYQSYLGNRYCRTAIYSDSENNNNVANWAKVRHGVPQGSVLGHTLLLLFINDLPKIINKTSAHIILLMKLVPYLLTQTQQILTKYLHSFIILINGQDL